jgi:large subunit ribosomal protein L25
MKFVALSAPSRGRVRAAVSASPVARPVSCTAATGQPQLIELDHNALWHALKKEAFHATILDMELNNGNQPGAAARRADAPVQAS